jgi:hypothetical protein
MEKSYALLARERTELMGSVSICSESRHELRVRPTEVLENPAGPKIDKALAEDLLALDQPGNE